MKSGADDTKIPNKNLHGYFILGAAQKKWENFCKW